MDKERIRKYAELLVKKGSNVQKNQEFNIYINCDQEEFASLLIEEAYKAGASIVRVEWLSDLCDKVSYINGTIENLSKYEKWQIEKLEHRASTLPAKLYMVSSDPDALNGVDQAKVAKIRQLKYNVLKPFRERWENKEQWCIAAIPSIAWAKKVFPNLQDNDALEALWKAILDSSRVFDDPIHEWIDHSNKIHERCNYLNNLHLKELRYTSSNGTNFRVGLIDDGIFAGGSEVTLDTNIEINPNIPSEEIFTSPKKGDCDGIVYATKPLSYQGELIEDFSIRFENGKAVEVHANKGEELLKHMISMDEGSSMLGECALISYDSPINNTNILFYETLFDENAACHLALGAGFTNLIKDYELYTQEELYDKGINDSMIHVDFMIGSNDLSIIGITQDNKEVVIFKNGNFVF